MQLYKHQTEALAQTEQFNRVGYFLDMGLGKTFVGAEKAVKMLKPILVVCQKSKIEDWVDHFRSVYATHDHDYCAKELIFDLTDKHQFSAFIAEMKAATETFYETDEWTGQSYELENNYPFIVVGIINYELIFRRDELKKLCDFTLMLDESSMITNPTAKRTKFVHDLHPQNVILLSGTPTGGKYEKLWSQLKLLGWKISEDAFFKNYVETEWIEDESGFKIKVIRGYKNVERLKDKLRQHGCIFMKTEEVFDLPEQIEIPIWVEPTKDFKKFMKDDMVILSDGVELIGDTKLTKRLYSRQLCGQYNAEKIAAFKDLLTSTDDRLIVFYNFNEELFKLTEIAVEMERPVSIVNGKTKDLEAYETRDDSITFVQYQAGAMGLNLQKANKVIYFTLPEWSDLYEQSKKRIHRIGQKNNCIYYLMLCKRSVEDGLILPTLKMRKDLDDDLFEKYENQFKKDGKQK